MTDPSGVRATGPSTPSAAAPIDELLCRFRRYLVVERGLRDKGARDYARAVRPFLEGRLSQGALGLDRLSPADVTAFVVASCPRLSPGTVKLAMTALRSLLAFLHLEGTIELPLAATVPSIASWRLAGLPKRLEPSQVRSLLAFCDLNTAVGRCDFAILTMLVRLGLRAGEIAALRFEDIDWRAGELVVRGKGRREERLPLPADVGEAVTAYLRGGRPENARGRNVFVTVRAPHRAMSGGAVSAVVVSAASRCGLGPIRAHRLRHTVASEALRGGASLEEVGQLLRHRRAMTTAIYAKVDREALRKVARRWPETAR
jgi:site-specific recombinase XerD